MGELVSYIQSTVKKKPQDVQESPSQDSGGINNRASRSIAFACSLARALYNNFLYMYTLVFFSFEKCVAQFDRSFLFIIR